MSDHDSLEAMLSGLNRPVQPRADFARSLERRLMAELEPSHLAGKDVIEMSQATVSSQTWPVPVEDASSRRQWMPVLEIAAVIIVAIGIGGAVLGSLGMLPGQSNGTNGAATSTEYPITPGAMDCTVEPRSQEEVGALVPPTPDYSNPDFIGPGVTSVATPPLNLQHSPADDQTTREIEAAIRQWLGCTNALDELRVYALYSDDLIRMGVVAFDVRSADSAPKIMIMDVSYVCEFDDGRAGAVVVVAPVDFPAAIYPLAVVFEKHGDQWLLDDFPIWWFMATDTVVTGDDDEFAATTPQVAITVVPREEPTMTPGT